MTPLRVRWAAMVLGVFGLAIAIACDRDGATQSPGGAGGDPGSRLEGQEVPGGQAEGEGKEGLPTVRDRDPEEEKKKMALSRRHSAEARSSLQRGALDSAIEQARQALRTHEQNVDAMLVVAEAFYKQGKYGLTQAVTSSALAVDPKIRTPQETSRAHNLMGFALVALGKDTQATAAFRKAAEADDKNAAAWNNLGTRYLDAGDVDTALGCFEYALELQPNLARAHVNHGAALRAKKRWEDAEKALMQALRLKKNYAEAYFNLGVLYLDADPFPGLDTNKRLNKAIASLTKYRELAIADGPSGPGRPSVPGGAAGKSSTTGRGPASLGPSVSRERADDYIRVAKKGLEREQRRLEREKERQAKGGGKEAGSKPEANAPEQPSTSAQPSQDKPDAPQQPAAKPQQDPPASGQEPSDAPTESPSAPASPPGGAPAPQKPQVQKPGGSG